MNNASGNANLVTRIYWLFDSKAGAYVGPLVLAQTDAVAVRNLTSSVRNPELDLNKYAEDYTLHRLGDIDPTTGRIIKEASPVPVVKCSSLLPPDPA